MTSIVCQKFEKNVSFSCLSDFVLSAFLRLFVSDVDRDVSWADRHRAAGYVESEFEGLAHVRSLEEF